MKISYRIFALVILLLSLGAASQVLAQAPLVITNPTAATVWETGSTYTVTWTGGLPGWFVNISLGGVAPWAVVDLIGVGIPNNGSVSYTVPLTVPAGGYLVYIENVAQTSWHYGAEFVINEGTVAAEPTTWAGIKALYR